MIYKTGAPLLFSASRHNPASRNLTSSEVDRVSGSGTDLP